MNPSDIFKFRKLNWQDYYRSYTTPRDWKKGARDIPFGQGAKSLYVDGVNGHDHNDGESWTTAFKTIQAAVDMAESWTTIFIKSATYDESVSISTDTLSLIGESRSSTIINSSEGNAVNLYANNVLLTTLQINATSPDSSLVASGNFNKLLSCDFSRRLVVEGSFCFLQDLHSTTHGILISHNRNLVADCIIENAARGITINDGLGASAQFNRLIGNELVNCTTGILIQTLLVDSEFNTILHNNLVSCTTPAIDEGSNNRFFENFFSGHSNTDNGFGIATDPYSFTGGSDPRPVICRNGWLGLSWADADLVALIKAKTDNLPVDPADASDIAARFTTIEGYHGVPAQDAVTDALIRDVLGKKSDTTAGTSVVSIARQLKAIIDNLPDSGALNDLASILTNQNKYWHWNAISGDYDVIAGTWAWVDHSNQHLGGYTLNSSNTVNDEIAIPFFAFSTNPLTLNLRVGTNPECGIATVYVEGTSQGTIDMYSAAESWNVLKTISITPARIGMNVFRFRIAATSAIAYSLLLSELWLS